MINDTQIRQLEYTVTDTDTLHEVIVAIADMFADRGDHATGLKIVELCDELTAARRATYA